MVSIDRFFGSGVAGKGDFGGLLDGPRTTLPSVRSYIGKSPLEGREIGVSHAVRSTIPRPGDGSGRSGEKVRGEEVRGGDGVVCVDFRLALSLYQSAGAPQDIVREVLTVDASEGSADNGVEGVMDPSPPEFARSGRTGVSGRALSVSEGFGGAVWTKDWKERTGCSIPSRDVEEVVLCLMCARVWLSRFRCMTRGLRAV